MTVPKRSPSNYTVDKRRASGGVLVAVLLLMCSCMGDVILHEYRHIPNGDWGRTDTLTFQIDSISDGGILLVGTSLRTTASFRMGGVWVVRKLLLHSSRRVVCDTVFIETEGEGIFSRGEGVALRTFSHEEEAAEVQQGESATLLLYHVMSREYLTGIQDVGVKISVAGVSSQHRSGGRRTREW